MYLRSSHLVHNPKLTITKYLNTSDALRDIQEQSQLMQADVNNMSTQMNNLSKRVEFIKTLQTKQASEREHSNDNDKHTNP
jgi:hypothetical protein